MGQGPRIAVIIVNYRTPRLALNCLASLARERTAGVDLSVMLVDGGSGDGSAEVLADAMAAPDYQGWATLLPLEINGGFGWANNQAILRILQDPDPADYLHILNPDAVVERGAVASLAAVLDARPKAGAVGSQLLEPDGGWAGSAFRFPGLFREFLRGSHMDGYARHIGIPPSVFRLDAPGPVDWVTGASVMLRAEAIRQVGAFDDGFFLYFEEVELMYRLHRAGWEIWHDPRSHVSHYAGSSTGVVNGGVGGERRLPDYWYQSRRRYFALTRGRFATWLAGMAWLLGDSCWTLLKAVSPGRFSGGSPYEREDLLRTGLRARGQDVRRAFVRWDAAIGTPPAWMG